jgi:diphosphomevalonate decarboxylase
MKATAQAPSNIAFIKYWGKKDETLRIPENGSVSMNLSNLNTVTTVEFFPFFKKDLVIIDGKSQTGAVKKVIDQLDRIRNLAKIKDKAKVISKNNFPSSTGLSSSASGFAALTLAGVSAAGLKLSKLELSILVRMGSGSACRSIPDGFVEWLDGDTSDDSYAVSIFPPDYWNILDVVVVVASEKKDIPTSEGQKSAQSSVFFKTRLSLIGKKISLLKDFIKKRDFKKFGKLVEEEALELHSIMLTSKPPLIYWLPETVAIMKAVLKWRSEGLLVYFTINTGQDVHLLIQEKNKSALLQRLKKIKEIKKIVINTPSVGAKLISSHLF